MKKLMTLVLALVMVLTLAACGSNKYAKYESINQKLDAGDYEGAIAEIVAMYEAAQGNQGNEGNDENQGGDEQPERPTDEESNLLRVYRDMVYTLNDYVEDGSASVWFEEKSYYNNEVLEYISEQLAAMESIDKWLQKEGFAAEWFGEEINCDRQGILAGISKVEGVLLKQVTTTTDNMGNVTTYTDGQWEYDTKGRVVRASGRNSLVTPSKDYWYWGYPLTVAYSEDGRISQLKAGWGDKVDFLADPMYDDAGNLVTLNIKTNNGEWQDTYVYDSQGRVIEYHRPSDRYSLQVDSFHHYYYTYDDAGRVSRQVRKYELGCDYEEITTYIYDDAGNLSGISWEEIRSYSQETISYITREDHIQSVYDGQGRLVSFTYTPGAGMSDEGVVSKPDYTTKVVENIYGDYYFYTPVQ